MYIVNTTFIVSPAVHGNWYDFFTKKFIPSVKEKYEKTVFTRVLSEQVEKHFTYSFQVYVADIAGYQKYMEEVIAEYHNFAPEMFDAEAMHFTSLMKIIEQ